MRLGLSNSLLGDSDENNRGAWVCGGWHACMTEGKAPGAEPLTNIHDLLAFHGLCREPCPHDPEGKPWPCGPQRQTMNYAHMVPKANHGQRLPARCVGPSAALGLSRARHRVWTQALPFSTDAPFSVKRGSSPPRAPSGLCPAKARAAAPVRPPQCSSQLHRSMHARACSPEHRRGPCL